MKKKVSIYSIIRIWVKTPRVAIVLISISTATLGLCAETELFVSPNGDDANPGTIAQPFRSLERARNAVRKLKHDQKTRVWLRGGVYQREKPFELTEADSGSERAPIVYQGFPDEEVRIVGGKAVTGWKAVSDAAVLTRLSPETRDQVVQTDLSTLGITDYGQVKNGGLELFFKDQPMTLARWPNEGFIKIAGLVEPDTVNVRGTKGSKTGRFMYDGDRPKRWIGEKDAWVHGYWFWDWSDERHPIASIDAEKRIISVKPPYHGYGYRDGQWFYGLNILAELDQPGDWHIDRDTGILTFWPPSGIGQGDAVVSVIPTLLTLKNVSHVTFRDLTFEACRGTAVIIQGGSWNRLADCTLRNLGGYAVRISRATESGVFGCEIHGTGDGGIALNGGDRRTLTSAHLYAENNHIHHYGRWNRMYKAGIHLGGVGNRAIHNLIHHAPHMAIGFSGNDHLIEFNEIHEVCLESNDAGAIYAGRDWTMRGTVIRHNYLHDISGFKGHGCVGVYLDDLFSGTKITGNVFYRVTRAAFIGGGRDCIVENNIFVDCPQALHVDARGLGWAASSVDTTMKTRLKAMPYTTEPWHTRYPKLVHILDGDPAAPKGNLIIRNIFVGETWNNIHEQARTYILLKDNLVDKDPLFLAKPPESFLLCRDSPAYELGFKPIPFDKIGLHRETSQKKPAPAIRGAVVPTDTTLPSAEQQKSGKEI